MFVHGFFLDGDDGQQPIITGVFGVNQYAEVKRNNGLVGPYELFSGTPSEDEDVSRNSLPVNQDQANTGEVLVESVNGQDQIESGTDLIGSLIGSDRRLKKNINLIGEKSTNTPDEGVFKNTTVIIGGIINRLQTNGITIPAGATAIGEPKTSVKSLRTYQVGVVYLDPYGRQTPVLTDNATGSLNIPK